MRKRRGLHIDGQGFAAQPCEVLLKGDRGQRVDASRSRAAASRAPY
jgi:hypothetical protein